jgi:hypothetical protein
MAKKIKIEFTKHQLNALLMLVSNVEAGLGGSDIDCAGGDADKEERKWIDSFDRALKSNGYRR